VSRVTADEATLGYESSIGGALAPGERVLWEDRPHLPLAKREWSAIAITVGSLTVLTATIAAIVSNGSVGFVVYCASAAMVVGGGIAAYWWRRGDPEHAELRHLLYRITDRRIIRADERPQKPCAQRAINEIERLTIVHGRKPAITIDHVEFKELPEVNSILLRVLELCAKSGRRRRVRRTPLNDPVTIARPSIDALALPPEIQLTSDERVLWIGKPRVRDPFDRAWLWKKAKILLWLLVPLSIILAATGKVPWVGRPNWLLLLLAGFWILMALIALILTPIQEARRRARCTYVLTSIRAIEHLSGRSVQVRSYLLDMAGSVGIDRRADGVSDLWLGSMHLARVWDGERLHAIALDAIRAAGIAPAGGIIPRDPFEEDDRD
jgi:hypothetical protein